MLCERHKNAVIEAAANDAALSGELREHLAECASCRAAFAEEQSLFAAIDSGLHAAANVEVPTSLLPRVRARLDEAAASRLGWVRPLVFAFAGVALALVVALMARPHRAGRQEVAKQGPAGAPPSMATAANTNREKTSSESTPIAAIPVNHSHTSRDSTSSHSAASSNPEVLVPPDEREGLALLVASLNEHRDLAAALLVHVPEKKDLSIDVERLQIDALEIKPLDGRETEALDSGGEKR
jgi:hypothetical protein